MTIQLWQHSINNGLFNMYSFFPPLVFFCVTIILIPILYTLHFPSYQFMDITTVVLFLLLCLTNCIRNVRNNALI